MKARAALVQMCFSDRTDENVGKGARLVKQAARDGAEIVCLPELATDVYLPFEIEPKWLQVAEPIDGPSVETMRPSARGPDFWEHTALSSQLRAEPGFFRNRRPDAYGALVVA